jgi:hypothetical protein
MVPVLDEDGSPKTVPVMKNGKPQLAKGGRPITRKVTEVDKSKPLPPRHCDYPSCPVPDKVIAIGTPFKVISIKRQFGGVEYFRHEGCPSWQPWEYSDSLSAKVARIQNMPLSCDDWDDEEQAKEAAGEVADAIEELAEEKEESAQNMEDGFGHETEQSAELRETADSLRSWAEEVRDVDMPDFPEADPGDCSDPECRLDHTEVPGEEQLDQWRQEAEQAIRDAMDNSPV